MYYYVRSIEKVALKIEKGKKFTNDSSQKGKLSIN